MLDNLLSNDELNISIISESQTPIINTLETAAQTTLPSRKKSSLITETENYISKKYDELALSHLKQQMLSEIREIIKYETDNAPKNDIAYLQKHIDTLTSEVYFLREELKEKNLLIKSILNKSESVNHDQQTLCHCKFVSQNENISKTVTVGDSIIKNINGYELSNQVEKGKIYMLNLTQDQRLDAWRITLNPHQERIQIT